MTAAIIKFPDKAKKADKFTADKFRWLDQIVADAAISPPAFKLAYVLITQFVNRQTGDAWPGQEKLAKLTGLSVRHVRRLTTELVCAGHLKVTIARHRHRPNRYRPIIKTGPTGPLSDRTKRALETGHTGPTTSFEENPLNREGAKSAGSANTLSKNGALRTEPYAFEGEVIRITAAHLERWRRAYPAVPDIRASLQACDDYLSGEERPGHWFFRASAWLKRENDRLVTRQRVAERESNSW